MPFNAALTLEQDRAIIQLTGELDAAAATEFHDKVEQAIHANVRLLEFQAHDLTYMSSAGLRSLLFARQKMGDKGMITFVGASEMVAYTIRLTGLDLSIGMSDS